MFTQLINFELDEYYSAKAKTFQNAHRSRISIHTIRRKKDAFVALRVVVDKR